MNKNIEQRKEALPKILKCAQNSANLSKNSVEITQTDASLETKLDMVLNNQAQILLNDSLDLSVICSLIAEEIEEDDSTPVSDAELMSNQETILDELDPEEIVSEQFIQRLVNQIDSIGIDCGMTFGKGLRRQVYEMLRHELVTYIQGESKAMAMNSITESCLNEMATNLEELVMPWDSRRIELLSLSERAQRLNCISDEIRKHVSIDKGNGQYESVVPNRMLNVLTKPKLDEISKTIINSFKHHYANNLMRAINNWDYIKDRISDIIKNKVVTYNPKGDES